MVFEFVTVKILVMGAGAIGSLFGGLLSKRNEVTLIARKEHVHAVRENGLKLVGKTQMTTKPKAFCTVEEIGTEPDLILFTVKSFDTEKAIREVKKILHEKTTIITLQNGLDNIPKITKIIDKSKVLAAVTTEAALFLKPGVVKHTGKGYTIIGELDGRITERLKRIENEFNEAGIRTSISCNIWKEIWIKAVINSCINPITAVFDIKNGDILEHDTLFSIAEKVLRESLEVAKAKGNVQASEKEVLQRMKKILENTSDNFSSMVQSLRRGKRTEIDSINGFISRAGREIGIKTELNDLLIRLVKIREKAEVLG